MVSSKREMAKNCAEELIKDGKLRIDATIADGDNPLKVALNN